MKRYEVVAEPAKYKGSCDGCLFTHYEDYEGREFCNEPDALRCDGKHIWVIKEIEYNER